MKEINSILEGIYSNNELRKTVVPLFLSQPGIGKTKTIEKFAEEKGVKLVEIITSQISPWEISGMIMPDKTSKKMMFYDFDKIDSLQDGDILFFDELLQGMPQVLSACLTLIESRRTISGKKLSDIMIVAAANPTNHTQLTSAIKQRFLWYDIKFDKESWKRYMAKYLITDNIFEQLCVLVQNESFNSSDKNYFTPRSIEKAIKMILAGVNTPYEKKLTPILNEMIMNNTGKDITLGETTWKANEMISWLKLQKLKNETNTIK